MKRAPAILSGLLLVLCLSAPDLHESRGQFGGTFIGAIVADDGVVIGADSRSTFMDAAGKRIGYVDRMQKLYVDRGAAVAVAGLTSVEDDLFSSFMRRNDVLLSRPVNEILFDVSLKLPFKNSTNVLLLSAGYLNGEANICAKSPNDPQMCRKSGYITNKTSLGLRRWFEALRRMPSSAEAAAALDQAITESADVDPTVGGPVSLVLVPKSGAPRWLKNPPENNGFGRVCDVVASYRKGQILISFINTKEELDKYLNAACPK